MFNDEVRVKIEESNLDNDLKDVLNVLLDKVVKLERMERKHDDMIRDIFHSVDEQRKDIIQIEKSL